MSELRRAAKALRASLEPRPIGSPTDKPRAAAISVLIEGGGQAELVSMRMRDGLLSVLCTCGARGCVHVQEALALFEDEARSDAAEERITHVFEPAMRLSEPIPMPALKVTPEGRNRLSDVLSDVLLAVTRSGISGGISAGVSEALERLAEHASTASATGLRTWVGVLKAALEARDTEAAVRTLAACGAMIDALRKLEPPAIADAHVSSWLGSPPSSNIASERATERTYLELAREHRAGLARAGVEQRYLIDLATGELFREDRAATEAASLGPCPRLVSIGLAHIESGHPPRRIRLLQYTTTPLIEAASWLSVVRFAQPTFESLLPRYKQHMATAASLTDMIALVKPARVHMADRAHLVDEAGKALLLTGPEGTASRLEGFMHATEAQWVLGRVHAQADMLSLVPLAACGLRHGRPAHLQL
jgi:hypothetical protein